MQYASVSSSSSSAPMPTKRRLRLVNSLSSAADVVSRTPRRAAAADDNVFSDEPPSAVESERLLQSVAELAQSCPAVNHLPSDEGSSAVQDVGRASSAAGSEMPNRAARRRRSASVRRIRINVSGHNFEVPIRLLDRHPDTLLGNARRRAAYYDRTRDELFLDRHRPSFEAIFSYYQLGGRLRRPHHVPDDIFLAEVEFYDDDDDDTTTPATTTTASMKTTTTPTTTRYVISRHFF